MKSIEIFMEALQYEEEIRDMYRFAAKKIDDSRGQAIFNGLADDEQSHVDFLHYSLQQLKDNGVIDQAKLKSSIPELDRIKENIETMKSKVPEKMLGNIKTAFNTALQMEKETSAFYEDAVSKTEGEIKKIFSTLLEFENRHVELVQIELDHASNNGFWFNFMEIDMEHG